MVTQDSVIERSPSTSEQRTRTTVLNSGDEPCKLSELKKSTVKSRAVQLGVSRVRSDSDATEQCSKVNRLLDALFAASGGAISFALLARLTTDHLCALEILTPAQLREYSCLHPSIFKAMRWALRNPVHVFTDTLRATSTPAALDCCLRWPFIARSVFLLSWLGSLAAGADYTPRKRVFFYSAVRIAPCTVIALQYLLLGISPNQISISFSTSFKDRVIQVSSSFIAALGCTGRTRGQRHALLLALQSGVCDVFLGLVMMYITSLHGHPDMWSPMNIISNFFWCMGPPTLIIMGGAVLRRRRVPTAVSKSSTATKEVSVSGNSPKKISAIMETKPVGKANLSSLPSECNSSSKEDVSSRIKTAEKTTEREVPKGEPDKVKSSSNLPMYPSPEISSVPDPKESLPKASQQSNPGPESSSAAAPTLDPRMFRFAKTKPKKYQSSFTRFRHSIKVPDEHLTHLSPNLMNDVRVALEKMYPDLYIHKVFVRPGCMILQIDWSHRGEAGHQEDPVFPTTAELLRCLRNMGALGSGDSNGLPISVQSGNQTEVGAFDAGDGSWRRLEDHVIPEDCLPPLSSDQCRCLALPVDGKLRLKLRDESVVEGMEVVFGGKVLEKTVNRLSKDIPEVILDLTECKPGLLSINIWSSGLPSCLQATQDVLILPSGFEAAAEEVADIVLSAYSMPASDGEATELQESVEDIMADMAEMIEGTRLPSGVRREVLNDLINWSQSQGYAQMEKMLLAWREGPYQPIDIHIPPGSNAEEIGMEVASSFLHDMEDPVVDQSQTSIHDKRKESLCNSAVPNLGIPPFWAWIQIIMWPPLMFLSRTLTSTPDSSGFTIVTCCIFVWPYVVVAMLSRMKPSNIRSVKWLRSNCGVITYMNRLMMVTLKVMGLISYPGTLHANILLSLVWTVLYNSVESYDTTFSVPILLMFSPVFYFGFSIHSVSNAALFNVIGVSLAVVSQFAGQYLKASHPLSTKVKLPQASGLKSKIH